MPRLNQYKVFVAVVETGSVSKAAKQLLSTPSSVSKQLSKLEMELDVRLINRSTQAMKTTVEGQHFYYKVKDILERVSDAENCLKEEKQALKGNIHLSLPSILLKLPIMTLLTDFNEEHPGITFKVSVSDSYSDLARERIDFAIRIGKLEDSRLTALQLGQVSLVLAASPRYLEKHGKIPFSALTKDQHLIIPEAMSTTGINKLMTITKGDAVSDLNLFHTTQHSLTLLEMAKAGLGISPLLHLAAKDEIDAGNLVALYPKKSAPKVSVQLVFRNHTAMPSYKLAFKEYIKGKLSDLLNKEKT